AATPGAPSDPLPSDPDWAGGSLYVDEREEQVDASPSDLWAVIEGIGGTHGWYSWSLGWRVRGVLDRVCGEADGTPTRLPWATRWTGGGWKRSSGPICCGCGPRCGCRGWPGSSSR